MTTAAISELIGPVSFIAALDLGQSQDYSALAILEKRWVRGPKRLLPHFTARHLQRWPLKTSYTTIVSEVADMVARPPLRSPLLGIDQTGVGAACVDMFRQAKMAARLRPVLITGGHQILKGEDGGWHVPKKELVSALQSLLQGRRLLIADVPERESLVKELLHFKVKITVAGNESFEAWRERDKDDLVLALAIAAWLGTLPTPSATFISGGERPELVALNRRMDGALHDPFGFTHDPLRGY